MFRKISAIALPLLVVALFILPLLLQRIATGQNGREVEIEVGKFDPKKAKAKIREAYTKHFDDEDFDSAIAAYQAVIETFPNTEQAAEAQFRIANIYHVEVLRPAIHTLMDAGRTKGTVQEPEGAQVIIARLHPWVVCLVAAT